MNPDLISALHPPRLPESFAALTMHDLFTAFGLGLLLAGLLLIVMAPLMQRRIRPLGTKQRLRAAQNLPPQERALELVRLLQERGGRLSEDERHRLYAGELDDLAALESRVRHARRARA